MHISIFIKLILGGITTPRSDNELIGDEAENNDEDKDIVGDDDTEKKIDFEDPFKEDGKENIVKSDSTEDYTNDEGTLKKDANLSDSSPDDAKYDTSKDDTDDDDLAEEEPRLDIDLGEHYNYIHILSC